MVTELFELENRRNEVLRWILTFPSEWAFSSLVFMYHGFERSATTEKKFKILSDLLAEKSIATVRMDFAWCGLSDGDFSMTTVESQAKDIFTIYTFFCEKYPTVDFSSVSHSMGSASLAFSLGLQSMDFSKIVLLAPALNQEELLRYWFVSSTSSGDKDSITWQNFKSYLEEEKFLQYIDRDDHCSKTSFLSNRYFQSGMSLDLSHTFWPRDQDVLHVHGDCDTSVPLESLNYTFLNRIIVEWGNHDLEKPSFREQWMEKVLNFLSWW